MYICAWGYVRYMYVVFVKLQCTHVYEAKYDTSVFVSSYDIHICMRPSKIHVCVKQATMYRCVWSYIQYMCVVCVATMYTCMMLCKIRQTSIHILYSLVSPSGQKLTIYSPSVMYTCAWGYMWYMCVFGCDLGTIHCVCPALMNICAWSYER